MNYSNSDLQSLLAAEYVLGTLRGQAAIRFEKLLQSEHGLRQTLEYWQYRINPLAEVVQPVKPPRRVWKNIQRRIHPYPHSNRSELFWNNLNFWRGFALASVMLVVGFGLGMWQAAFDRPTVDALEYIAILQDHRSEPVLVASVVDGGKALKLDMLSEAYKEAGQIMQVWCIPKDGGEPVSVGFINSESNRFNMTVNQMQMLHDAQEIAVSIEPIGGSPFNRPSGPVMYRGSVL